MSAATSAPKATDTAASQVAICPRVGSEAYRAVLRGYRFHANQSDDGCIVFPDRTAAEGFGKELGFTITVEEEADLRAEDFLNVAQQYEESAQKFESMGGHQHAQQLRLQGAFLLSEAEQVNRAVLIDWVQQERDGKGTSHEDLGFVYYVPVVPFRPLLTSDALAVLLAELLAGELRTPAAPKFCNALKDGPPGGVHRDHLAVDHRFIR